MYSLFCNGIAVFGCVFLSVGTGLDLKLELGAVVEGVGTDLLDGSGQCYVGQCGAAVVDISAQSLSPDAPLTAVSAVHPQKAESPISVTEAGMSIDVSAAHS